MCRELSCFSTLWPSNIYLPRARFGKLQTDLFSPGVPNQTSIRFRTVSVAVICLKTDISTECNAALSLILFEPVWSTSWEGSSACLEMVTTSIIESPVLFPAIVCCFMVYFDFSQLANAESSKHNKTIGAGKRIGSLIKF